MIDPYDKGRTSWGFDKGSPDGDTNALTLSKNGKTFTFTGAEADTILEYVAEAERLARIDEWSLIGETLHSANIAAELHIHRIKDARIAALSNKPKEEK